MHRPLLRRFSGVPWIKLAELPTPVERFEVGAEFGLKELWIKRDDLTAPRYGGNKVRKLEFLLADAKARGAHTILTYGATGSTHALATALYGREHGFRVVSILSDEPPSPTVSQNLLLGAHWGAELVRCAVSGLYPLHAFRARLSDTFLYEIPAGGSCPVGVLGFVNAGLELAEQIKSGELPPPAAILVASGTSGTQTGLGIGLSIAGFAIPVIGVRVAALASEGRLQRLSRQTCRFLSGRGLSVPHPPGIRLLQDSKGEEATWREAASAAGLNLTCTAKVLARGTEEIKRLGLEGKPVLFWNTDNGADLSAELEAADPRKVPPSFRSML
ncbi:MAG: 1-aminocyclopropane-1-carboxylate deaminase/D-cysteine desulfhydrase [Bacteroidota bacterium]